MFRDFNAKLKSGGGDALYASGKPMRNIQRDWTAEEDAIMLREIDKSLKKSGKSKFSDWMSLVPHFQNRTNKDIRDRYYRAHVSEDKKRKSRAKVQKGKRSTMK